MNIKHILSAAAILFFIFAPLVPEFAAAPNVWDPKILNGPLVTCTGDGSAPAVTGATQLPPCQSLCDLVATVVNIIYFGIGVVIWIIVPITFAVGGIMYLVAGGKPEMLGAANKTLTGAIVGVLIVLCAWLLISTILAFLNVTQVGGFGSSACSLSTNGIINETPPATTP